MIMKAVDLTAICQLSSNTLGDMGKMASQAQTVVPACAALICRAD